MEAERTGEVNQNRVVELAMCTSVWMFTPLCLRVYVYVCYCVEMRLKLQRTRSFTVFLSFHLFLALKRGKEVRGVGGGEGGGGMSSVAKKMLQRHGWKEGMGLGKNAQGVTTYVKVVRRDPKATTGLGHAADSTQAPQSSTFALELDAVYSDLSAGRKQQQLSKANMNNNNNNNNTKASLVAERDNSSTDESTPRHVAAEVEGEKNGVNARKRFHSQSNRISGNSDTDTHSTSDGSDSDDAPNVDVTRMTDDELLRRCGGVRLGRAGRHRFFEGKLRRIEDSHHAQ